MKYPPISVKVWGDFACFTRPEAKVERVSYEVMTPSAARNILQSIFWKPEFDYRIREIHVLHPIRFFSIMRNEALILASAKAAQTWASDGGGVYVDEERTQRHTLALRDVAYVINADIVLRPGVEVDVAKYRDQLRRRVEKGQCYSTPYLGCREFAARFGRVAGTEQPINISKKLGRMLFDMTYADDKSGRGTPRFFEDAELRDGILHVPPHLYGEGEASCC